MPGRHEELKTRIRHLARKHGFDLCRFTRPAIASKFAENLDRWLASGFEAGMHWMREESRLNRRREPATMLDGVRSVICVAMRYSPPPYSLEQANAARDCGVIAAYAHGDDYHEVMKKRLKALARDLDGLLGPHDQRVYVDTAPVLEHALAEGSGLGWQGRHSLTIHRDLGSWFLLGELFTTADLAADEAATFHCGSCTACLDICPTRAIAAPFFVDANRCISYHTIENRGYVPHRLRRLFGNRIYGCDDCQAICPWNRHARAPDPDLLVPRGENILPGLASLLALDEAGFRARFRKSPVKRTGRTALQRNVCIAMGNSGRVEFIGPLMDALEREEAVLRAHAFWALAEILTACRKADGVVEIRRQLGRMAAQERDEAAHEDMRLTFEEKGINHVQT